MGVEFRLYCFTCADSGRGNHAASLGKWCSELAQAAIRGTADVKKQYKNYRDHTVWKYKLAKEFAEEHTDEGHEVRLLKE